MSNPPQSVLESEDLYRESFERRYPALAQQKAAEAEAEEEAEKEKPQDD